jgi:hypothetical protein
VGRLVALRLDAGGAEDGPLRRGREAAARRVRRAAVPRGPGA